MTSNSQPMDLRRPLLLLLLLGSCPAAAGDGNLLRRCRDGPRGDRRRPGLLRPFAADGNGSGKRPAAAVRHAGPREGRVPPPLPGVRAAVRARRARRSSCHGRGDRSRRPKRLLALRRVAVELSQDRRRLGRRVSSHPRQAYHPAQPRLPTDSSIEPAARRKPPQSNIELLLHEQMHVLQRAEPELFDSLYKDQWGFIRAKSIKICPWIVQHQLLNPDAIDCPWVFPIRRGGQTRYILAVGGAQRRAGAEKSVERFQDVRLRGCARR